MYSSLVLTPAELQVLDVADPGVGTMWTLTELHPFTEYNVSIWSKPMDGGYASDIVWITVTTNQAGQFRNSGLNCTSGVNHV